MSELIQNDLLKNLETFAIKYISGQNHIELIDEYSKEINSINAFQTMHIFHFLLEKGYSISEIKPFVGKFLHLFYKSLHSTPFTINEENHFISFLIAENRAVDEVMNDIQFISKKLGNTYDEALNKSLIEKLELLKQYELHYIKMENIVFPYIEKTFNAHGCLQLMWSFHDDYRKALKELIELITKDNYSIKRRNELLGILFFTVLPIIFREEYIVFPISYNSIPQNIWESMFEQAKEIGWCFISEPNFSFETKNKTQELKDFINLESGELSVNQIIGMLNCLPVDITFIDHTDEVKYFSEGAERIFPRSRAIIGRKVQNCHPPESVHVVQEIIDAFKNGSKDVAEFWITMKGLFLHIRYFAVRHNNEYIGTVEVSQNVTEIRSLTGERRLLEWK